MIRPAFVYSYNNDNDDIIIIITIITAIHTENKPHVSQLEEL